MTESDKELIDIEAGDDLDTDALPDVDELDLEQLDPLLDQAESVLASVTEGEEVEGKKLQALFDSVTLIQGLLDTTDVDDILDTVDLDETESVVDLDSLPEALASGELGDAVELQNLYRLIEFGQLWDAVDLTELMGSKDEISETVGELTGDDEDGGLLDDLEMEDFTGGEDGEMASGLTDSEMIQAATQAQLDSAIDGFRDLLVETHAQLDELREANQRRFDGVDQPSSRNPTAVSTLTTHRGPPKDASRASTVPRNVRHSTGPSRRRIYGRRFEKLMAETQADEEGEGAETEEAEKKDSNEVDADE